MAEKINSKRVVFSKGRQRSFINKILSKISVKEAAEFCNLSERTIRDWRRERFLMNYESFKILAKKADSKIPNNIKLRDNYWYVSKGSSIGGIAVYKKYGRIGGDPEYRKKKWREWWRREGRYRKHPIINITKSISKPKFSSNLAEFTGIILGDGGITERQVRITLHDKDDREYGQFVIGLAKKLFNVPVGISHVKKDSVINYVISRTELVRFCTGKMGLKKGNKIKQQADIPNWIKKNKSYCLFCLRGLIDTDGCIFTHRYKSKGKWYSYKKIAFTSFSTPLLKTVFKIFKNNGFNPRFARGIDVRLDSTEDVKRYFSFIGSSNPKHLKRYAE